MFRMFLFYKYLLRILLTLIMYFKWQILRCSKGRVEKTFQNISKNFKFWIYFAMYLPTVEKSNSHFWFGIYIDFIKTVLFSLFGTKELIDSLMVTYGSIKSSVTFFIGYRKEVSNDMNTIGRAWANLCYDNTR